MLSYVSLKNKATGIALLVCAALFTQVAFATQQSNATPWPQASSDLKPDPAVKYGVLTNGMRYIIMHNNTPTDTVSLRLRMATGSIQESDAQQGIAHLLEHMAFRGSKHVPDGDVVKTLERIGLQFGADTNAYTTDTQTVYKFDLPHATDSNVNTGLMLLREIAGELNITDEALKTERGVVLSELRLRDTAEDRASKDEIDAMLPGMRAPTRWTIGKADIIEKADAKVIRGYYEAYYHPERATLIVVGNIDPAVIANKISAKFSSWKLAKHSAIDPDFGTLKPVANAARIYVETGLPTSISLDWGNPYDASANRQSKHREDVIRSIGLTILNQRFQQIALGNDAPFAHAEAGYFDNLFHSVRGTSVDIDTTPEKWQSGLSTAQHTINNVLLQGVRQDEVDRVVADMRTALQTSVTGANTRRTQSLADSLVNSLENNDVFLSPQQNAELSEAELHDLKAEVVTTALRAAFTGTNQMVFMTSSAAITGGEATLASAYKEALSNVAAATDVHAITTWPYTNFGAAGSVVKQQKLDGVDATVALFSNGVRLIVKHTDFTAGQLDVMVKIGDGKLALDKHKANATFLMNAFVSGGLQAIDFTSMQQALAGKTFSISPSLNEENITLRGTTTPADIDTQLQVMTAYVTAPAFRSGAVEQLRTLWSSQLPQIEAQPLYNLSAHVPALLRSDDSRWAFPTVQQIKDAKLDDLKAWLVPQLQQGSIQITIVGDISTERAITAVAATLGALPARPVATLKVSAANEIKFPAATPVPIVLQHSGAKDKAATFIAWPAADRRTSLSQIADLQMLGAIMNTRLLDAMRSRTGSSYTANVGYDGSWCFTGFGNLQAISDITPEHADIFFDAINSIVDDLRKTPVSADEFARAQQPFIATVDKARQTNSFFVVLLVSPDFDPLLLQWLNKQPEFIKAVTPERVQAVAQKYLVTDKAWKAVMLPQISSGKAAK